MPLLIKVFLNWTTHSPIQHVKGLLEKQMAMSDAFSVFCLCRTSSFEPLSLLLHPLGLKRGSEVTLGLFDLRGGEVTLGLDERDKLWLTYDKS